MRARLVTVVAAAAALLVAASASADTITVRKTHDGGRGSLRRALKRADPGDVIRVPAGKFSLTRGELRITKSLTVDGAGPGRTVIDAGRASRVFEVTAPGAEVALGRLAVQHGKAVHGGGILNAGDLTLRHVSVRHNIAAGTPGQPKGGGIASSGDLTLNQSAVTENRAKTENGFGGGIAAPPVPTSGGPAGSVSIVRSSISGNEAAGAGGLIYDPVDPPGDRAVKIRKSTFADNVADRGQSAGNSVGGALYFSVVVNSGSPEISLSVTRTTFAHNVAVAGGQGVGGAMLYEAIANSAATFPLELVNDTFAGNRAGDSTVRGIAGALYLLGVFGDGSSSTQTLNSLTIARNRATGSSGLGGGLLFEESGSFAAVFRNTIVAKNHAANGPDCGGSTPSGGHNLEGGTSCDFTSGGDLQNTDPLLGRLAHNGGPTKTLALLSGSPAIGAGGDATCPPTDQRGVHRPQGPHCDIGAFERKRHR